VEEVADISIDYKNIQDLEALKEVLEGMLIDYYYMLDGIRTMEVLEETLDYYNDILYQ
jgi:hypothetical protein